MYCMSARQLLRHPFLSDLGDGGRKEEVPWKHKHVLLNKDRPWHSPTAIFRPPDSAQTSTSPLVRHNRVCVFIFGTNGWLFKTWLGNLLHIPAVRANTNKTFLGANVGNLSSADLHFPNLWGHKGGLCEHKERIEERANMARLVASQHRQLLNVCKGMNTYWTFHPIEDFLMCAHNVGLPSYCSVVYVLTFWESCRGCWWKKQQHLLHFVASWTHVKNPSQLSRRVKICPTIWEKPFYSTIWQENSFDSRWRAVWVSVFGGLLCTGQVHFRDSETTKGKKLEGKKAAYIWGCITMIVFDLYVYLQYTLQYPAICESLKVGASAVWIYDVSINLLQMHFCNANQLPRNSHPVLILIVSSFHKVCAKTLRCRNLPLVMSCGPQTHPPTKLLLHLKTDTMYYETLDEFHVHIKNNKKKTKKQMT